MNKLANKIWALILFFLVLTIAFMYIFTDYLYEELYVRDTEQSMIEVGEKLQTMYQGGKVDDHLIDRIEDYSAYSNYHIFAVRNPRELSACVPFDIDYNTLIGPNERQMLLTGQNVIKIGYEERFDRQVISVILPFTEQNRLEGIIYLYYPLAKISELANTEVMLLLGGAVLFSLLLGYFVWQGLRKIMRPLHELQHAAEKMSQGQYETRVNVTSKDELGQLSRAFNNMAEAIQHEDEQQKTFLATVSHELRTPISYVKGYSEVIENNLISGTEREEAIRLIAREANRMERLTNDLIQLARPLQENEGYDFEPIVLAETIRDVVAILQKQAVDKRIKLNQLYDEEIIVIGDEEKLKQIFINIIENAIRYSNANTEIQITTIAKHKDAVITIQDNGIGIPKEDLPRITDRFYRVNKARSRADGGSGLGLSIVDQLVKQHNGQLSIQSELNKGTCVIVTVPILEE